MFEIIPTSAYHHRIHLIDQFLKYCYGGCNAIAASWRNFKLNMCFIKATAQNFSCWCSIRIANVLNCCYRCIIFTSLEKRKFFFIGILFVSFCTYVCLCVCVWLPLEISVYVVEQQIKSILLLPIVPRQHEHCTIHPMFQLFPLQLNKNLKCWLSKWTPTIFYPWRCTSKSVWSVFELRLNFASIFFLNTSLDFRWIFNSF